MTRQTEAPRIQTILSLILICAACLLVYRNSFDGVFVFDDGICVTDALEIRTLVPPWEAMFGGIHYPRPIAGLSFAVNYAISALDIWSYHLFNLVIHVTAGLALFGISILTLRRTRLQNASAQLALAISLIWTVHPLQTEAVTYITQRYESLMGMFFLLSVFCFAQSREKVRHPLFWQGLSIGCCYLAVGSKQVAALIPVVIVLYDRTFISGSFRQSLARSWRYFLLLFSSWIPLAVLGLTAEPFEWAGFDMQVVTPVNFALSQFGVIVHYLRLAIWPDNLVFDYFWQLAVWPGEVLPYAIVILALVSLSVWGLIRNHPLGFLGAVFFLVLSPTSSIMPLSDLAADHRMYLPLIPVIVIFVTALFTICRRFSAMVGVPPSSPGGHVLFPVIILVIASVFGSLTIQRNALFASKVSLWEDTAKKVPHNPRAWANLGNALLEEKRYSEAIGYFKKALELRPNYSVVLINLGYLYNLSNEPDKAIYFWEKSLQSRPHHRTYYNLGLLYQLKGKKEKAAAYFEQVVARKPRWTPALIRLAWLYAVDGSAGADKRGRSLQMAQRAIRFAKTTGPFHLDTLAAAYAANGRFEKARQVQERALTLLDRGTPPLIFHVMRYRLNRYLHNQSFTLKPGQIDLTVRFPR